MREHKTCGANLLFFLSQANHLFSSRKRAGYERPARFYQHSLYPQLLHFRQPSSLISDGVPQSGQRSPTAGRGGPAWAAVAAAAVAAAVVERLLPALRLTVDWERVDNPPEE